MAYLLKIMKKKLGKYQVSTYTFSDIKKIIESCSTWHILFSGRMELRIKLSKFLTEGANC